MALLTKISKAFSDDKSTSSGKRDQVIQDNMKKTRLIQDSKWIRNKESDDSSNLSVDVNYGKIALSQVKSEESENRSRSGPNKVTSTTKYDTFDGRNRDSGSTGVTSPTKNYSSLATYKRKNEVKTDNLPKIPSTKNDPAPLIDLTPTREEPTKGSSNFLSKFGSKSLKDLSTDPEKKPERTPDTTSNTPVKTQSLIDLTPNDPNKAKRSREDWGNTNSQSPTSTKTTFNPTARSPSTNDWDIKTTTKTTTKSTFDTETKTKTSSTNKGDGDSSNSYTWTTFDTDSKNTRSASEQNPFDEPTIETKTSNTFSFPSSKDKSPGIEEKPYSSRSSYKENSPPYVQPFGDDESLSYQSSKYSLPRTTNSSSSLSDVKSPAKVITLTTAYSSAEQITKDKNLCSQCFKPLNDGPKMILQDLNINCHASCLKCQICHKSLENMTAGDHLWIHHNTVHCEKCYDDVNGL